MKKTYKIPALKTYQIPSLNQDTVFDDCLLLVGTTVSVDPGEEGSQSQAESKMGLFEDADNGLNSYGQPDAFHNVWEEE